MFLENDIACICISCRDEPQVILCYGKISVKISAIYASFDEGLCVLENDIVHMHAYDECR